MLKQLVELFIRNSRVRLPVALHVLALLVVGAGVIGAAYHGAFRLGLREVVQNGERRLEHFSADLALTLEKFNTLPVVLSRHPDLIEMLRDTQNAALRDKVNKELQFLSRNTHVEAIFVVGADGRTLAASNWESHRSFIGKNSASKHYFRDALRDGIGHCYAVEATTGEAGYFLAHRVQDDTDVNTPLGVVVVKISLDTIEASWRSADAMLALADSKGIVFLTNRPEWKFHSLDPLDEASRQRLQATRRYGDSELKSLPTEDVRAHGAQFLRVQMHDGSTDRAQWIDATSERRPIGTLGWTLISFSALDEARDLAKSYALVAGFAYAFALVLMLYARLRQHREKERSRARTELERMSAQLDAKIQERTAVLVRANEVLAAKIDELDQAQNVLRATQDELIQAGKLAVLGQLAASITHEINQPLAALRALNDNSIVLLERGEDDEVAKNLRDVTGLTQRIAAIVTQLKGFARKDSLKLSTVAISSSTKTAISLVAADARRKGVSVVVEGMAENLRVLGQSVRIEQILVNLLRNGIDACCMSEEKKVAVHAKFMDGWIHVVVEDTGAGISPDVLPRLFEPFFTTKSTGDGLGLGLAISGAIASELGGTLHGTNRAKGGAVFTLRLRKATVSAELALASPSVI